MTFAVSGAESRRPRAVRTDAVSADGLAARDAPARQENAVLKRLSWLGAHLVASATVTYGKIGLGFPEARIVFLLGRVGQMTGIHIAEALGVDRGGVSRALKSLTRAGLIERVSGDDRLASTAMGLRPTRSHRGVRLTASGLTILDKVAALTEGREHMLLSGFAPEERADLVGYLDRLLDNFTRVAGLDLADADAAQHGRRTR